MEDEVLDRNAKVASKTVRPIRCAIVIRTLLNVSPLQLNSMLPTLNRRWRPMSLQNPQLERKYNSSNDGKQYMQNNIGNSKPIVPVSKVKVKKDTPVLRLSSSITSSGGRHRAFLACGKCAQAWLHTDEMEQSFTEGLHPRIHMDHDILDDLIGYSTS